MDGFMETGGGLDAAFEAALLGGEEPQEDAELDEEPGNPQENEPGAEPENPPEGEPGEEGGAGGGEPPNNPQEPEGGQSPGGALGGRLAEGTRPEKGKDTAGENPTRAGTQEGNKPPEVANVDVGGARVPADALRAVSQTLGRDAGELIRRGMAYDSKAGRELSILNDFAAMAGMDLTQYLGYLEQARDEQELSTEMEKIRGRYPEGTPDEALRDIAKNMVLSRRAQAQQARQAQERQAAEMQRQAAESERDGAMRREIEDFRRQHPEIKGSADVPQAVWDAINASGGTLGLNAAYTAYERDQAKAEAEKLRGQLAAAQKMGANRAASTGSMEGAGEDDMDAEFKRILLS